MGQENLPWNLVEGKKRADDPRFWPGGAQLSGETFENALIVDVDITAAELIGATFKNCTLARLDLRDGFMSEAIFENCIFYKCDLRRADLSNASLTNVIIDRSNLCSAKFTGVKTSNFKLTRSEASPCDFRKSILSGYFSYCDLSAVNFDGADIDHLELYRCNIKFSRVNAQKHECTTSGIEAAERAGDHQVPWFLTSQTRLEDPSSGNLENAYFFGKDLSNADFSNRTLKNVNFLRCNLVESNFSNVTFDNVWFWDCEIDQMVMNHANAKRLTMNFVTGTIQAENCNFQLWNVSDSELEGSNFQGSDVLAATFSMSQFQNSNFSNQKHFIVESFMTDFINCNFEGTDTSAHAAERSYIDEGVPFQPISESPLRTRTDTGDILELYLPPEGILLHKTTTPELKSSSDAKLSPLPAADPKDSSKLPLAAQTPKLTPSPEAKSGIDPFQPVEEDAFLQNEKSAPAPAQKPVAPSLSLSPVEDETQKPADEPAKAATLSPLNTSPDKSTPKPTASSSTKPNPSTSKTGPSAASPLKTSAPHKPVAPPLDLNLSAAPAPETKKRHSQSVSAISDSHKSDKLALNSEKTRPAGPNLAEALKAHEHATGKKPDTDTKKPSPGSSQSSKLSSLRASGSPLSATLSPQSSLKPSFGNTSKAPFGSAAKPSTGLQSPSSPNLGTVSKTPTGQHATQKPSPYASQSPKLSASQSPKLSPLGAPKPTMQEASPQTTTPAAQQPHVAPTAAPSPVAQPAAPATQTAAVAQPEPVVEPAAPVVEPTLDSEKLQTTTHDPQNLSGVGGVNTAPPGSRPAQQASQPAPAAEPETKPEPVAAQPTTPSTDMVHHSDVPKPGFFARIINWFKSLFGG